MNNNVQSIIAFATNRITFISGWIPGIIKAGDIQRYIGYRITWFEYLQFSIIDLQILIFSFSNFAV